VDRAATVDRAALTETARMAVTSSLTVGQTAVSQAQARRVLASYVTLGGVRDLVADRTSFPDQGHPTPPAEDRYEDAGGEPAQGCTATIRWIVGIEQPSPRPDGSGNWSPFVTPEMLSRREREVLGYAPSTLSAAEIGSELFVSVNTVKAHLRSIYRKLGVTRRRDAVIQARRQGLL